MLAYILWSDYTYDALTLVGALYEVVVTSFGGLLCAIAFWYTVTLPLIKRRKKGP